MLLYFPEHKIKYAKIPKNACSTVINSLGWSVIQDRSPHQFDHVFQQTDQDTSEWPCLAVFRDPYERLVSGYFNKLVITDPSEPFAAEVLDIVWRNQRGRQRPSHAHSITFREFVLYVCAREDADLDQHWQSQSHHLDGATPTIVINMNSLRLGWEEHPKLRHIPLRDFAPHATRSALNFKKDLTETDGYDLGAFKRISDQFPSQGCFRNGELENLVRRRYHSDYELLSAFHLSEKAA